MQFEYKCKISSKWRDHEDDQKEGDDDDDDEK